MINNILAFTSTARYFPPDALNNVQFTYTLTGAGAAIAPANDAANGTHLALALPNVADSRCQLVHTAPQTRLRPGARAVVKAAFQLPAVGANAGDFILGLVETGDGTLNGGTNFVANHVSIQTFNNSPRLFLLVGRQATGARAAGGNREIDTGIDVVAGTIYYVEIEVQASGTLGLGSVTLTIGSHPTDVFQAQSNKTQVGRYAIDGTGGALAILAHDRALALAMAVTNPPTGFAARTARLWYFAEDVRPNLITGQV